MLEPVADCVGGCLREERLADAGLTDQQDRTPIRQPLHSVEFFDLRLADRSAGGEVDVLERRAQRELGGFDAGPGFAFLAIMRFSSRSIWMVNELPISRTLYGRNS